MASEFTALMCYYSAFFTGYNEVA